jgi:hypothetical protein
MKLNWKILIASLLIVVALFWTFDSLRTRSYSGTNLNFGVGGGVVTVTNPSEESIPVQLIGSGTRSFSLTSSIEGVEGNSTRQGTGRESQQLFEFSLPAGVTEFTVVRGEGVNFVSTTDTRLSAVANPVTPDMFRGTLIAAVVVVLGAIFYISSATGHRWLRALRGVQPAPVPVPVAVDAGQGRAMRAYGDNRDSK